MKCGDIMSKNVESVREQVTITAAAALMADSGVGFLPICDEAGRAIGVVTDRDVVTRAVARKLPLDAPVHSIMSAPVVTCPAAADLELAESLMVDERLLRLVITDRDDRVAGVLSLADVIEHASGRAALRTAQAILWRDALGPRGGAAPGEPLLKDEPISDEHAAREGVDGARSSVFTGGHWSTDTKEFPG